MSLHRGTDWVRYLLTGFVSLFGLGSGLPIWAQAPSDAVIPHNQSAPPGPALSPTEAIARMTVPSGFTVELVASEPQVVNPVAMTIDERGRFWITESFEYPRRSAGPGRDRIKVLEDTDQDGQVDRVTIFAEGLNIPSGIAVGHGGVWVANSPDLLFLQDTDGDGRADKQEVVLTGFGRTDTHELPNSLTWGPDGWLYGLNGVFNYSQVVHRGQTFDFTCALFRIHPRTREFELFAEGTSNPWGVAFDGEGSAFVSACVIDHLWHLTESGYYHRQGGPYPPFTWKLESIVDYTHQMAAYCGITYFDSDAYPAQYREKLYMGNIHGGCINADYLTRHGSTYRAQPDPDFLTANDSWFMPVVQKTGPDGCLYILDWYDRYHCYQDANRDPEGIDRGRGRLYRVRYQDTPRAPAFDLGKESDAQLIERLRSPNIYYRDLAQRLLAERADPQTQLVLGELILSPHEARKTRLHALWSLISQGPLPSELHLQLLRHQDTTFRAWAVRAAGNQRRVATAVRDELLTRASDPAPDVRLQVAIAANKLVDVDALTLLASVLGQPESDPILPRIVWRNLQPHLDEHGERFIAQVAALQSPSAGWIELLPHAVRRLLAQPNGSQAAGQLVAQVAGAPQWTTRDECLYAVRTALLDNPTADGPRDILRTELLPVLQQQIAAEGADKAFAATLLAGVLGEESARVALRSWIGRGSLFHPSLQQQAFEALAASGDPTVLTVADALLADGAQQDLETLASMLSSLGRLSDPRVAEIVLQRHAQVPAELQPRIIELLTQRNDWSHRLIDAIAAKQMSADALHINQIRRLQSSTDASLTAKVFEVWGKIREGRNPAIEETVERMEHLVNHLPGDAARGQAVFRKTCAQCHRIYGEGEQVGPDITGNGRASFEQLLSNVFDPNLVIGRDYQARTLITSDGRTLSGLLVEESDQRVVLKLQGGKQEAVARDDIEELVISPLSLMPEGWEKQLPEQELVDLLHFLTLDGPPDNSASRRLPGTPELHVEQPAP